MDVDWETDGVADTADSGAIIDRTLDDGRVDVTGADDVGEEEDDDGSPCDICREGFWEDDNQILLCDGGCGRSAHQTCYGVLSVPEGDWKCRTCEAHYDGPCIACLQTGGMMKRLTVSLPVASKANLAR